MQYIKILLLLAWILPGCGNGSSASGEANAPENAAAAAERVTEPGRVITGAEMLLRDHLAALQGQRVALVANHTTRIPGGAHLVDTLLAAGVQVVKVFSPEHGFRGQADAGQRVRSQVDPETGLPLVSLYGSNKKPTPEQLADVDLVMFDIQDVGTRFYTYISTMSYVMEACAESGKAMWVLDRPNPNGWYVDGPVLVGRHSSFIGLHEIPIVHGMTVAEYAQMVNAEGWLANGIRVDLTTVACQGYHHAMRWRDTGLPWVAPSPNLATEYAAYLYPALCWFEPTPVSIGRGTDSAFTVVGADWFAANPAARLDDGGALQRYGHRLIPTSFIPRSLPGKSTYPKFQDVPVQGYDLDGRASGRQLFLLGISLMEEFYQSYPGGEPFFRKGFPRWPGNERFRGQIEANEAPEAIYDSWRAEVIAFEGIRSRYLMYP